MTNDHYIPKVFLKRFQSKVDRVSGIWVFRKGRQEPEHARIDRVAAAQDYYLDSLDEYLRQTESRVGPILERLTRRQEIPARSSAERATLMRFMSDLMLRNPRKLRVILYPAAVEVADRAMARFRAAGIDLSKWNDPGYNGEPGDDEDERMAELIHLRLGHIDRLSPQAEAIVQAAAIPGPMAGMEFWLDQRHWRLLRLPPGTPLLITSDDPVVDHDDAGRLGTGIRPVASRVTWVLTPRLAFQGCSTPIDNTIVDISLAQAMRINWIMTTSSHREIFAAEPSFLWRRKLAGSVQTHHDWLRLNPVDPDM